MSAPAIRRPHRTVLFRENASREGVARRPNPSFTTGAPGWGAFERVTRHGELDIDDNRAPVSL